MKKIILAHLARLRREQKTRWATESHHCVVCGAAFGPNMECKC